MASAVKKIASQKNTLKKVLKYIEKYRFLLIMTILFEGISVVFSQYIPILTGRAIDFVVGAGKVQFEPLLSKLTRISVMAAGVAVLQWISSMINNRITFQVMQDIRNEAFAKIEILPFEYIDNHPYGEVVSRVIADVDQFADGLLLGFSQLFTGVMTILGTLYFMFSINWKIALIVAVMTPLSLVAAKFIADRTFSMFRTQSEIRAEQTGLVDEMIGNQKVVQAFSHGEEVLTRFDEINGRLEEASLKATFFSSLTNPVARFVNSLVYAAVSLSGGLAVLRGRMTVGGLVSFLSYANQYTKPFNDISGVVTELENALVCAGRIFELIEETPQKPEEANAVVLKDVSGRVSLENVEFSYVKGKSLIRNLNLRTEPGQRIAIVGPTGCGKTTIINLLMRFYDADSGSICVEGNNVRNVTRGSLRSSYGMVLQDTWLRRGTIRENIVMGRPDITEEQMIEAAKASHAHEFIRRLPEGYDTVINEDGGSLSQGQKQLLCISRIMLCRPPMLILDEATSSIDTRTELKIQAAFSVLMKGRTSFIVAHRLSTIREADMILVMRDGKIIEQGRHEDLLKQNGFYAELYNSQFAA